MERHGRDTAFQKLGRSVGRLDVLTNSGTVACTAFLVSRRHLITTHDCVLGRKHRLSGQQQMGRGTERMQFVLGYMTEGVEAEAARYRVDMRPLEAHEGLDYAVFEVEDNPGDSFGWLNVSTMEPLSGTPLWIIGHPLGKAQRISYKNCKSENPAISARGLRHTCNTLPGNAGSPVIDPETETVVAIHRAGKQSSDVRSAVPMSLIASKSRLYPWWNLLPLGQQQPPPLLELDEAWRDCQRPADDVVRIDACSWLIDEGWESPLVYLSRGSAYLEEQECVLALDDVNEAIRLDPSLAEAYSRRAYIHGLQKRHQRAIKNYDKAIELKPLFVEAYTGRGIAYRRMQQYRRSIEDHTRAIELDPSNIDAINSRGVTYFEWQKIESAIDDFTRTIELKPDHPRAYYSRGGAHAQAKQYSEAIRDFTRAIEINPLHADGYRRRGEVLEKLGFADEAGKDFRRWSDHIVTGSIGGCR
ncbi:MAG: tetratricopeptide repeat protein [Hyphomicrobiaceae bacterium]